MKIRQGRQAGILSGTFFLLMTLKDMTVQSVVVTVLSPAGASGSAVPTGIVFSGTTNFMVTGGASHLIFAAEDGTISEWNSGTNATLKADNSASGAYTTDWRSGV